MSAKELTEERGTTHGSFSANARVSQELKATIHRENSGMTNVQREAIDMICMKLSRIASGHAHFADHWEDIQGYCQLVLNDNATVQSIDDFVDITRYCTPVHEDNATLD